MNEKRVPQIQIGVYIDKDTHKKLIEASKEDDRTVSKWASIAIKSALADRSEVVTTG